MSHADHPLTAEKIASAVDAMGLIPLAPGVAERFSVYFDLLLRWNAKLNLTAIRSTNGILRRHFLECIFCAQNLPEVNSLLDYGSGAGFPGIPIALCRPQIRVTLAESQGKKASFLREAVRELEIDAYVYAGRVSEMPAGRVFHAVAMRAVDQMQQAVEAAKLRVTDRGWLILLANRSSVSLPNGFIWQDLALPDSTAGSMAIGRRIDVPRETNS